MVNLNYSVAGYYLVQGRDSGEHGPAGLPAPLFWTVSGCICPIYPGAWGLPWVKISQEERERISRELDLHPAEFQALQTWVNDQMEGGNFGWPDVFLEPEPARQFYRSYLRQLPRISLIRIALPETYLEEFTRLGKPAEGSGEPGVYAGIRRGVLIEPGQEDLGYDILGYDLGSFHSSACHYLYKDFKDELGISLNEIGLIEDYDQAVRAAEYTRQPGRGVEPALWQPWLLTAVDL